jgi:hypothetical protein
MPRIAHLVGLLAAIALIAGCGGSGNVLSGATTAPTASTTTSSGGASTTTRPGSTTTIAGGFEPPRPQTTPNVSQPPDSLLDGTHVAFLVDVDVPNRQLQIDVVQWFNREDFDDAIAAGRLKADDPCVDLDYCIVNNENQVRTMNVTATARVSVVDYDHCCTSMRTDDLASALTRLREGRDIFVLTAQGGKIVAVDELYLA